VNNMILLVLAKYGLRRPVFEGVCSSLWEKVTRVFFLNVLYLVVSVNPAGVRIFQINTNNCIHVLYFAQILDSLTFVRDWVHTYYLEYLITVMS
jgi:hypothetical protein